MTTQKIDTFTRAYIHAAAFTEDLAPPEGEYPGPAITDLNPDFVQHAIDDCNRFQAAFWDLISDDLEHAGRDFWYTRNHHGCGFWDGGWPDDRATVLTNAAHAFGEYEREVFKITEV